MQDLTKPITPPASLQNSTNVTYNLTGISSEYKWLFDNANSPNVTPTQLYTILAGNKIFRYSQHQWLDKTPTIASSAIIKIMKGVAQENLVVCSLELTLQTWKNDLIYSLDNGDTWTLMNTPNTAVSGSVDKISSIAIYKVGGDTPETKIYFSYNNPTHCLTPTPQSYVLYTDDFGATWNDLQFPFTVSGNNTGIIYDIKADTLNVYVTASGGVFKYDINTSTWTRLSTVGMRQIITTPTLFPISMMTVNPFPGYIYATKDEGANWIPIVQTNAYGQTLHNDHMDTAVDDNGTIYMHNIGMTGIYTTTDLGDNFNLAIPLNAMNSRAITMARYQNFICSLLTNNTIHFIYK